jgi:hypothetical protein
VSTERFLVTGALGCIGAWSCAQLVREGVPVVAHDLGEDTRRLESIMSPEELARLTFVKGDILDLVQLEQVIVDHGVTHLIHLAAMLLPLVKADPPRGAAVNVVGTTNVMEAAKRRRVRGLPTRARGRLRARRGPACRGCGQAVELVRRLQAHQRRDGARLLRGRGFRKRRASPLRRLRARPTPWLDRGPDACDGRGRRGHSPGANRSVSALVRAANRGIRPQSSRARFLSGVHARKAVPAAGWSRG